LKTKPPDCALCSLGINTDSRNPDSYQNSNFFYYLYCVAFLIPDNLMSVSSFNRRWAAVILEALTRHGVRHVCIAPGSRSTPLTLAAAENRALIHHTHFDERGLGHLALGLAKVSKEPVAVIVTSGTAVANLYPALIEAGLTGEKLILLTADRPLSLSTAAPIRPFVSRASFLRILRRRFRCRVPPRIFRQAGWSPPSITPWSCAAGRCISTVRLPSRCTASWTTRS
jgi:hypothetical protein